MKRGADRQLTKDDEDEDGPVEAGVFDKAPAEEISQRRKGKKTPTSAVAPSTNVFGSAPTNTFNFMNTNTTSTATKTDAERISALEKEVETLKAQLIEVNKALNIKPKQTETAPVISAPSTDGFQFMSSANIDPVPSTTGGFAFTGLSKPESTEKETSGSTGGFAFTGLSSTPEKQSATAPSFFSFGDSKSSELSSFGDQAKSSFSFSSQNEDDAEEGSTPVWSQGGDYNPSDNVVEAAPSVTLLQSEGEPVKSGEEEESTLFSQKAKLFELESGEWKERGIGTIKLNQATTGKQAARLVMRKEQVLTIILNAGIFAEMKCQTPQDKSLVVSAIAGGKPQSYLIKFQKPEICKELKDKIDDIKVKLGGKRD